MQMGAIQIPLHSIGKPHLHDTSNLSEVSEKGENWAIHNISVGVIFLPNYPCRFSPKCHDLPYVIFANTRENEGL